MTKYANGKSGLKPMASGNWIVNNEVYSRTHEKTFSELRDDLRIKRAMQRAICRESAPQYLIGSIREMIRGR